MKPFVEEKSKPLIEDYLVMMKRLYEFEATKEDFEKARQQIFKIVDTFPASAQIDLEVVIKYRLGRETSKSGVTKYMKPIPIKKFITRGVTLPDDITSFEIAVKPIITMKNKTRTRMPQNEIVDQRKIIIGEVDELRGKYPKFEENNSVQAFTIEDIEDFSKLIRFAATQEKTL